MARSAPALTSFNAGELDPKLDGRVDLAKYHNGCARLEGFVPLVQGPLQRRPGTRFVQPVKDETKRAWLRRFEFSATQAFVLEFGDRYIRFYANHGPVLVAGVSAWDNATDYTVGDLVEDGGVHYYCIAENLNQQPPNATYWYPLTDDIYEIPTPYALADLENEAGAFALQIEQSGDVLYIAAGGTYEPMKLTRFGATRWVLSAYRPINGPFMDQNRDDTQVMWASGQTGTVTITANFNAFASTDVGRLIRLQSQTFDVLPWEPDSQNAVSIGDLRAYDGLVYKALNADQTGTSPPVHESGVASDGKVLWEFQDAGYGIARITAYVSATQVTAEVLSQLPANVVGSAKTITAITNADPAVVTSAAHGIPDKSSVYIYGVAGMTEVNHRFYMTDNADTNTFQLVEVDSSGYGTYTSGGTVVVNATRRWSLGAWSKTTGYPSAVAFGYDRLWWGKGLEIDGSVPADYENMAGDIAGLVRPDCAIRRTLSAQDVNGILWMIEADRLLIGTPGGEFALGPITTVDPLGPDNVQIKRQSKRRCRAVRPVLVGTSVIYAQRSGRRLLALDYAFEIDRYRSTDLNVLNAHVTKGGIIEMTYQPEPDSIIWCALEDGGLIALTIDQDQEVLAWHRQPIGGDGIVESIETIPSPDGGRDEVWLIVRREIDGQTRRYVEYIERPWERGDDPADVFYVDSGLTYDGPPTTTISGLDHLEGETVQIAANGASHPDRTVTNGQITLDRPASKVTVGLHCPARAIMMRLEAGSENGTSQGKIKRIAGIVIRLLDTLGGFVGMEGRPLTELKFRKPSMAMDQPPEMFTGDIEQTFDGDYETSCRIQIEQRQPFPMTIAGIYPDVSTYDQRK